MVRDPVPVPDESPYHIEPAEEGGVGALSPANDNNPLPIQVVGPPNDEPRCEGHAPLAPDQLAAQLWAGEVL